MKPEAIGIPVRRMVLGKHSGRHAFEDRLKELGYTLQKDEFESCFARFKELCDKKKDVSDQDIEALVRNLMPEDEGLFKLKGYSVQASSTQAATAVISLEKDGEVREEVALGNGPVDAAYTAVDTIIGSPDYGFENYVIQSVSEERTAWARS